MTFSQIEAEIKILKRKDNLGLISEKDLFRELKELGIKKTVLVKELEKRERLGLLTQQDSRNIRNIIS